MDLTEVIAIAKTLSEQPLTQMTIYFDEPTVYMIEWNDYTKQDDLTKSPIGLVGYGGSWEEALRSAGWNSENSKPKTRKSTRNKTGWKG